MIEAVALSVVRGLITLLAVTVGVAWVVWLFVSVVGALAEDQEGVPLWGRHRLLAHALFWPPIVVGALVLAWGLGGASS